MQLTAEITLYPMQEDYKPLIRGFIHYLSQNEQLKVETFPTATIVCGEFQLVMDTLRDAMAWGYEQYGRSVFVAKFLPGYEAI